MSKYHDTYTIWLSYYNEMKKENYIIGTAMPSNQQIQMIQLHISNCIIDIDGIAVSSTEYFLPPESFPPRQSVKTTIFIEAIF